MSVRVEVQPSVLRWARQRSGVGDEALIQRFPKLAAWESREASPTLKQLEAYARATHTPIGFLLLQAPPAEAIPIPDYRTVGDAGVPRPSADLLDTIFLCQQRQEWYRRYAEVTQEDELPFVDTMTVATDVATAADAMRTTLGFDVSDRGSSWSEALRRLIECAENAGILMMVSGVVGSNTHRKLDPREFRGFSLVDARAPVIFVNGSDTKSAQIFTVAHELAHVWLGETALDDPDLQSQPQSEAERWCNQVAAEMLVPLDQIRAEFQAADPIGDELERLARMFRVSTLVVLRRVYDSGGMSWHEYRSIYQRELARVLALAEERSSSGGNFFNTQPARVSKRFARAVIVSTLEGQTLHRDAYQMLGFKKVSTFNDLAAHLGVV